MVLEQNGVKIGILGFCETPECETSRLNSKIGAAMLNISNTIKEIKSLREVCCSCFCFWWIYVGQTKFRSSVFSFNRKSRHVQPGSNFLRPKLFSTWFYTTWFSSTWFSSALIERFVFLSKDVCRCISHIIRFLFWWRFCILFDTGRLWRCHSLRQLGHRIHVNHWWKTFTRHQISPPWCENWCNHRHSPTCDS